LIFYIEPDVPDSIHTLTLSYTLYKFPPQSGESSTASLSGSEKQTLTPQTKARL
jgi:cytochrome c oxidase assembly protein subunit 11